MENSVIELLDKIFQTVQNVPPNAPLSEVFTAYQKNLEILDKALKDSYNRGLKQAETLYRKKEIEKQKNQN